MSRYLVSLIGELVIPNLLLIKTLTSVDKHVFLCPRGGESREKVGRLCAVSDIYEPLLLEVEEFSLEDADRVLKNYLNDPSSEYWVNLTSGSRIMALAAFEHFRKLQSQIFYLPPYRNVFIQLWPDHIEHHLPIKFKLSLKSCLEAHGVKITRISSNQHSLEQLEAMYAIITKNSNSRFMNLLNRLGSEKRSANKENKLARLARKFSQALGISEHEVETPAWLSFIKGAWFEEYMAYWLDRIVDEVYYGVVIEMDGVQNELDCVFMHENRLHFVELKASANIGDLNEFLYKLDSLGKDFGLLPRCFLGIADPDVEHGLRHNRQYLRRAKVMGINILTYSQLKPENIEKTLREVLFSSG